MGFIIPTLWDACEHGAGGAFLPVAEFLPVQHRALHVGSSYMFADEVLEHENCTAGLHHTA